MRKERRDFLKITTAGAAGLALVRTNNAFAAWPSSGKMEINPNISNMRVVGLVDTKMMKSTPTSQDFAVQNAAVDWPRVQANMDAMAVTLTQKSSAEEAWKTIFRTGAGKAWADTVVAIKVNAGTGQNTAHLAVLQKFSNILVGYGVQPKNFIVYDGHSPATSIFTSSFSTTDKSKVLGVVSAPSGQSGDLLGGWKDAKLANGTTRRCAAKIADGTVDILIDIGTNKTHDFFGKVTLCMKNHYGTWEPDTQHTDLNNLIYNMNKADAIIGGDPPRQQLCFVDSMFASPGVFSNPDKMPCYFVMGTFAPAVDYLTVKKVREETLKLTHDKTIIDSYLTSWGYTTSDPQWILVPPASDTPDAGAGGSGGNTGGGGSSGSGGAGGGGTSGRGGANAGGSSGSGGASSGGSSGSGGASSGGSSGSGGASSGGTSGSGGVGSGGTKGSGGAGSGGTSGSGGASNGGASGSGGSGTGGSTGSGGSGGSGGGLSGSGGSMASGGTTGGMVTSDASGCACRVGGGRGSVGGLGVALAFGALIAGQLRRLFLRREVLAQPPKDESSSSSAALADDRRDQECTKEKT